MNCEPKTFRKESITVAFMIDQLRHVVGVTKKDGQLLIGASTDLIKHFMEVRGLGLVDVRAMFGIRAIRFQKRVEAIIHMELWNEDEEYTRLGMVDEVRTIMGVELPVVKVPVTPGKNITVICEVIAMNHLLAIIGMIRQWFSRSGWRLP